MHSEEDIEDVDEKVSFLQVLLTLQLLKFSVLPIRYYSIIDIHVSTTFFELWILIFRNCLFHKIVNNTYVHFLVSDNPVLLVIFLVFLQTLSFWNVGVINYYYWLIIFLQPSRKRKRGSVSTPHQKKTKNCKPFTPCTPVTSKVSSPSLLPPGLLANKVSSSASKAAKSLARFQMSSSPSPSSKTDNEDDVGTYTHEKLEWLKEDKRRYFWILLKQRSKLCQFLVKM